MNLSLLLVGSTIAVSWLCLLRPPLRTPPANPVRVAPKPNIIIVMADQWRAQDLGYMGNRDVITPHLDRLAGESVNARFGVASVPVCSPSRASLLTGQHATTHGVFYNDRPLRNEALTLAEVCGQNGYRTGFIGKWHVNGSLNKDYNPGRLAPIPVHRRQGFDYWRVLECTHDYNNSAYYNEVNQRFVWQQYDAISQTDSAIAFMTRPDPKPFLLVLAWGPPHDPYQTAPKDYRQKYANRPIALRANVPTSDSTEARRALRGYYAHINALDDCIGRLQTALKTANVDDNTIFVFTSDHGDMLYSQGMINKQKPWDESIRIPMLLKYPAGLGRTGQVLDVPVTLTDLMPTLLSLSGQAVPQNVDGQDLAPLFRRPRPARSDDAALIACVVPFHQWNYAKGGREYRGLRTTRYTYVRDLNGPWLLYDNERDPYQRANLINRNEVAVTQRQLDKLLSQRLKKANDRFLPGNQYMERWDYPWAMSDSVGNPYYR